MNKLKYVALLVCFLFLGQGCNDLLNNPEPSTQIDPSVALNNASTIESVRASMYDNFHNFTLSTRNMLGPAALADNSTLRNGATRFSGLNQNRDTNSERTGLNDGSYTTIYDVILKANSLINGIPEGVLSEDVAQQYRAEALTVRAYAMHYLVRVLGYEPGMSPNGFNLGIIIRTEVVSSPADVQELPRNTVEQVYTQIKSDLNEAISLFPGSVSNFNYMNQAFAQGILARVLLYEGSYGEANTMAGNAIATSGLSLVSDSSSVADMFDETSVDHPESIMTIDTNPSTEGTDGEAQNASLNVYTANQWVAQLPTQSLIDLYGSDDNRLGWFGPCSNEAGGAVSGCTSANANGWEMKKWNAEQGQFADDYPLMRIAELKLIQAEARYYDGNQDVVAGLVPLNELRTARGASTLTPVDLQLTAQQQNVNPGIEPFIAEILQERRRELAMEGHRFFDLKRMGLNIPDPAGDTKISYSSYKILDDIAPGEIETNPELEQNPGY